MHELNDLIWWTHSIAIARKLHSLIKTSKSSLICWWCLSEIFECSDEWISLFCTRLADRICWQFSCAALTEPDTMSQTGKSNGGGVDREVWVCNSDGYVGHMCLLSLQSEPIVTLNTPVPGCNSRITCICAAPPAVTLQPQTPTRLR